MMISRRNFFSITIMMFVVCFLFLFSGAAKMALSNYEINEYARVMHREVEPFSVTESDEGAEGLAEKFVLYIGSDKEIKDMIKEWCRYNRYDLLTKSPGSTGVGENKSISEALGGIPFLVMVDGASITSKEAFVFSSCETEGIPVIFCQLP
ncbi:MAG: hypothetical protein J6N76_02805, partial [Lachnospiraceae bacterium]|nr:hypothetical protein [Lachnospiraceae bacterium]